MIHRSGKQHGYCATATAAMTSLRSMKSAGESFSSRDPHLTEKVRTRARPESRETPARNADFRVQATNSARFGWCDQGTNSARAPSGADAFQRAGDRQHDHRFRQSAQHRPDGERHEGVLEHRLATEQITGACRPGQ
jgi:hypothetical protein